MLPAYLMGFKVENFKKNLGKFIYNKKIILSSAKLINKPKIKNAKILVFFNYVPELNNFLYWSQQLFAESSGKNKKGFIPVISNAEPEVFIRLNEQPLWEFPPSNPVTKLSEIPVHEEAGPNKVVVPFKSIVSVAVVPKIEFFF